MALPVTATPAPASARGAVMRKAPAPRILNVSISPSPVYVGALLDLRVYANVGHAMVLFRLNLPAGATVGAVGHTDAHGIAERSFHITGDGWLDAVIEREASRPRSTALPRGIGATYSVAVTWRGRTIMRWGTLRIIY